MTINNFLKIWMIFVNEYRIVPKSKTIRRQLYQGDSRIKPGGGGGGFKNIFFLSPPLPFQAFRKWWYLPHCYLVIELGWTSEKRKKNSDLKYQNIFLAKSNNIAKQKTSLQDLCNMLPFINGNLDRYFFFPLGAIAKLCNIRKLPFFGRILSDTS